MIRGLKAALIVNPQLFANIWGFGELEIIDKAIR